MFSKYNYPKYYIRVIISNIKNLAEKYFPIKFKKCGYCGWNDVRKYNGDEVCARCHFIN